MTDTLHEQFLTEEQAKSDAQAAETQAQMDAEELSQSNQLPECETGSTRWEIKMIQYYFFLKRQGYSPRIAWSATLMRYCATVEQLRERYKNVVPVLNNIDQGTYNC